MIRIISNMLNIFVLWYIHNIERWFHFAVFTLPVSVLHPLSFCPYPYIKTQINECHNSVLHIKGEKKMEHPFLKRHKNSCVHCSVSKLGHPVGCRLQSRQGILQKQLLAISNQHTLSLLPDFMPKIFSPSMAMCTDVSNFSKCI